MIHVCIGSSLLLTKFSHGSTIAKWNTSYMYALGGDTILLLKGAVPFIETPVVHCAMQVSVSNNNLQHDNTGGIVIRYLVIFILHYYLNAHHLSLNKIHPRVEHPTSIPPNDGRNPSWMIHPRKPSLSLAFLRCHRFLLQSLASLPMNASYVDS